MKERYEIIKWLYPDYLILFKEKDDIKFFGDDKEIIEFFSIKRLRNVNKIILNNLDIEEKEEHKNNEYNSFYIKYKLINVLMEVHYEK